MRSAINLVFVFPLCVSFMCFLYDFTDMNLKGILGVSLVLVSTDKMLVRGSRVMSQMNSYCTCAIISIAY